MAFARELRALRVAAGTPKFSTMERRTGRSKSTLAEAAGGRHLPRWDTVADYVRACEADPEPWRARWEAVRADLDEAVAGAPETVPGVPAGDRETGGVAVRAIPASAAVDDPQAADVARPEAEVGLSAESSEPDSRAVPDAVGVDPRESSPSSRRRILLIGATVVAVLVLAGVGVLVGATSASSGPAGMRAIEVQNKVALGPSSLVEDKTPAYLSTMPLAYCASADRSCKVAGTEMGSGARLVADCVVRGQQMWNYNLAEAAAADNPERSGSDLWYRATFPDGRVGYLSEVYLTPASRGGLGLDGCEVGDPSATGSR